MSTLTSSICETQPNIRIRHVPRILGGFCFPSYTFVLEEIPTPKGLSQCIMCKNINDSWNDPWKKNLCNHLTVRPSVHNIQPVFFYTLEVDSDSGYLITWNFRDTLASRFYNARILRLLNFAILLNLCTLNHFNFAIFSKTLFI